VEEEYALSTSQLDAGVDLLNKAFALPCDLESGIAHDDLVLLLVATFGNLLE